MISCLTFIPKEAPAAVPTEFELPADELEALVAQQAKMSLEDSDDAGEGLATTKNR